MVEIKLEAATRLKHLLQYCFFKIFYVLNVVAIIKTEVLTFFWSEETLEYIYVCVCNKDHINIILIL